MATTLTLTRGNIIHRAESAAPLTNAQRDAERRLLSARESVVLFDIIPTRHEEQVAGAWGYGRIGEREEQGFMAMAARFTAQ